MLFPLLIYPSPLLRRRRRRSALKPSLRCFSFSFYFSSSASLRTNKHSKPRSPNTSPNTPLHSRWPSRKPPLEDPPRKIAQPYAKEEKTGFFIKDKGQNAIERIVLWLRNLGLGVEEGEGVEEGDDGIAAGDFKDLNMVVVNSSSGLAANLYLQSGNFMQKATKVVLFLCSMINSRMNTM